MSKDAANSTPPPPGNWAFSAVLLAGGKSTRMGFDKAGAVVDGQVLWRRQVATLRGTDPREIFISGKPDGPYVNQGCEVIADLHPGCGPLSGLEAALSRMRTPLLCVLAVDLPWMTAEFLRRIVQMAIDTGRGVVPKNDDSFEPLAAVYPSSIGPLVAECLQGSDHSMRGLIKRALELELIVPNLLNETDRALFRNVNAPADL